jgi:hypothetical protein
MRNSFRPEDCGWIGEQCGVEVAWFVAVKRHDPGFLGASPTVVWRANDREGGIGEQVVEVVKVDTAC